MPSLNEYITQVTQAFLQSRKRSKKETGEINYNVKCYLTKT